MHKSLRIRFSNLQTKLTLHLRKLTLVFNMVVNHRFLEFQSAFKWTFLSKILASLKMIKRFKIRSLELATFIIATLENSLYQLIV